VLIKLDEKSQTRIAEIIRKAIEDVTLLMDTELEKKMLGLPRYEKRKYHSYQTPEIGGFSYEWGIVYLSKPHELETSGVTSIPMALFMSEDLCDKAINLLNAELKEKNDV